MSTPARVADFSAPARVTRIASIDIVRGAVMVLMALDHVRVYSGLPAGGPTPGIFITRWITHFCAPAFVFLAGTSAFLYGRTHTRSDLSRFLLTRGAGLVLLELTVIRLSWTFNLDYAHYVLAGVIWMIGVCLMLMAGLVWLPLSAILTFGLIVSAGHNATDSFMPRVLAALADSRVPLAWQVLYFGPMPLGESSRVAVLYSIVPWIGVMAAGYAFGAVVQMDGERRRRWCLAIGLGAVAVFIALRGSNVYGNPEPWAGSLRSFLSTAKYPASLSFLLMTLGPTIAVMPLLEQARSPVARVLAVFGRVPLFFYLLHIPLIHVFAMIVSIIRLGEVSPWLFANHPMGNPAPPDGYTWSLPLLYGVWTTAVLLLYQPSRWFDEIKRTRRSAWLSYV